VDRAIDFGTLRNMNTAANCPTISRISRAFFITFSTHDHWTLPGSVRQIVIDTCLAGNGRKFCLYAVVLMSEHVLVVLAPKYDANGRPALLRSCQQ
jgi:hypothetical protein